MTKVKEAVRLYENKDPVMEMWKCGNVEGVCGGTGRQPTP